MTLDHYLIINNKLNIVLILIFEIINDYIINNHKTGFCFSLTIHVFPVRC